MIDSDWFYQQLKQSGRSLRDLARELQMDASAVSRMLRGERKMSAEEQDGIAAYLGVSIIEVAMRRRGEAAGFGERGQEGFSTYEGKGEGRAPANSEGAKRPVGNDTEGSFLERIQKRMAGTVTIPPGVDVTEPADPEWGRVYDDDYEYPIHL